MPAGVLLLLLLASEVLWLDVPFVRQRDENGCGTAVATMLLQYWRLEPRDLPNTTRQGLYASELDRYLQSQGLRTVAFSGEWADLDRHLEQGQPLIAALKTGRNDRHFVIVAGIDRQRSIILLNDPARRKLIKEHRAHFEKQWKGTENWTLLAVPSAKASP